MNPLKTIKHQGDSTYKRMFSRMLYLCDWSCPVVPAVCPCQGTLPLESQMSPPNQNCKTKANTYNSELLFVMRDIMFLAGKKAKQLQSKSYTKTQYQD